MNEREAGECLCLDMGRVASKVDSVVHRTKFDSWSSLFSCDMND